MNEPQPRMGPACRPRFLPPRLWIGGTVGLAALAGLAGWWCAAAQQRSANMAAPDSGRISAAGDAKAAAAEERHTQRRRQMVERQLRNRDITDERVLAVLARIPRHEFVPPDQRDSAYEDHPLPIGCGQTISQPYIVALMTQLAQPKPTSRALDVGTGSGYQAAVLGALCKEVYSIEIVETLAKQAKQRLADQGYRNVEVRAGDGYRGRPEHAPFDLIIVAAAPDHIPPALVQQLAPGGKLIIPVGRFYQDLIVLEKKADGQTEQRTVAPVAFVPMTGAALQTEEHEIRNTKSETCPRPQ